MINALLLSNSTMPGTSFFTWPVPWVKKFLQAGHKEVVFVPFAAVTISFREYSDKVEEAFGSMGIRVTSLHASADMAQSLSNAGAIVVGGGNTFALLAALYQNSCVDIIRRKVQEGVPYIGWSAGANLACPTIMTTNDMPVVQPPTFEALGLVPFQINPHYHELRFEGQGGETRKERLEEFLVMNPGKKVIGLPEGMFLQRNGDKLFLGGTGTATLYLSRSDIRVLAAGADLSFLL